MVLRSSITDFISFTPVSPCQVSLVVGVVEERISKNDRKVSKVEVGSPWRGLCSGQLLGLEVLDFFFCNIMINQILNFFQIGQKLPAFFRSSSFKLPEDPTKPVKTVSSPLGIQFNPQSVSIPKGDHDCRWKWHRSVQKLLASTNAAGRGGPGSFLTLLS